MPPQQIVRIDFGSWIIQRAVRLHVRLAGHDLLVQRLELPALAQEFAGHPFEK